MRIAIICGSPKGEDSISLVACKYIENKFPEYKFTYHHAASKINRLIKDKLYFDDFMKQLDGADGYIWAFPVYTFLAPVQLQQFNELIYQRASGFFKDKYAASLSTSMNFYDHTAHNYLYEVFNDFGLHYTKGISLASDDLLNSVCQKKILSFSSFFFSLIASKHKIEQLEKTVPLSRNYTYKSAIEPENQKKDQSKRVIVLTDYKTTNSNLKKMIDDLQSEFPYKLQIYNINNFNLKGGCLGCMDCFVTGQCIYKDNFSKFHQEHLCSYDAIIYALTLNYHCFSVTYKTYQDRLFYNGHMVNNESSPGAFLISGKLQDEPNIKQVIEAITEVGHQFCAGIVTDNNPDSNIIRERISSLAKNLAFAIDHNVNIPQNFLGLGGKKILRDVIYKLKHLNPKDHKFYKQQKFYDYPQKDIKNRFKGLILGSLFRLSKLNKRSKLNMKKILRRQYDSLFKVD